MPSTPDASVTGHETLIAGLTLPDADHCHVLAAAIRCNSSVTVTFNEKDFPASALAPYGIEAQHPDLFIAAGRGRRRRSVDCVDHPA